MQKPSTILIAQIQYWFTLVMALAVIYLVPARPQSSTEMTLFYNLLLAVAIVELIVMKIVDYRMSTEMDDERFPGKRRAAPIVLGAFTSAVAIYGILVHFMGGSQTRALSFVGLSVIGYVEFLLLSAKYASLPNSESGE